MTGSFRFPLQFPDRRCASGRRFGSRRDKPRHLPDKLNFGA